jgi:hypothetical protein
MMMYETDDNQGTEHAELIDMRTHLTVAMLAASQLNRKTQHLPEAMHLQDYLDQSLKSLVEDVGKVDALVAQVEEGAPAAVGQPRRRMVPRLFWWARTGLMHGAHTFCARLHHRHYTRIVAPSLYR